MRNYMESDREMERQMEYRRRKQLKKLQRNIFYAVLGMTLVLYGMRIRQLGVSLTKVQTTLKQIEALQQKAAESSSDEVDTFGEQQVGGQLTADFISSIQAVHLDRPIKRTREEAVQRLKELGQSNPVIAQIGQKTSRFFSSGIHGGVMLPMVLTAISACQGAGQPVCRWCCII